MLQELVSNDPREHMAGDIHTAAGNGNPARVRSTRQGITDTAGCELCHIRCTRGMLWTTGDKTQQTGTDVSVVSGPFAPYAISTFLVNAAMAWAAAPGFVYRAK